MQAFTQEEIMRDTLIVDFISVPYVLPMTNDLRLFTSTWSYKYLARYQPIRHQLNEHMMYSEYMY